MKKVLADKIRSIRAGKGFKQEDIADQLGIVVGTYSNIERGVTDITVIRLYQIAKILKVSIYDLLPEERFPVVEEPVSTFDIADLREELKQLRIEIKEIREAKIYEKPGKKK